MKHIAKQLESPVVNPPLRLSLTLTLDAEDASRWRRYAAAVQDKYRLSNAQMCEVLLSEALKHNPLANP